MLSFFAPFEELAKHVQTFVPREELIVYGYVREHFKTQQQELPPTDMMGLFTSWFTFSIIDSFDKTLTDQSIIFDPSNERKIKGDGKKYSAVAIGKLIVEKGEKQQWKFEFFGDGVPIIGIVDTEPNGKRGWHSDTVFEGYNGYGLELGNWDLFANHDSRERDLKNYMHQFGLVERYEEEGDIHFMKDPLILTMELDMTQAKSKQGTLKYFVENQPICDGVKQVRTDGVFANIAYDDIDINKKYRMAVRIVVFDKDQWIESL